MADAPRKTLLALAAPLIVSFTIRSLLSSIDVVYAGQLIKNAIPCYLRVATFRAPVTPLNYKRSSLLTSSRPPSAALPTFGNLDSSVGKEVSNGIGCSSSRIYIDVYSLCRVSISGAQ